LRFWGFAFPGPVRIDFFFAFVSSFGGWLFLGGSR
jgi:hypothetical protein